jgi:DNA-binding beta-propeller fold protein YncE
MPQFQPPRAILTTLAISAALLILIAACSDSGTGPDPHAGEHLYVLNENSQTLYIYHVPGLSGEDRDSIPMQGDAPHHLHFSPDGAHYYVVSRSQTGLGRAYRYEIATNEVTDSTEFQGLLTGLTTDPHGTELYISNFGTNINQRTLMYRLDPATLAERASFQAGSQPHYIETTSDGELVVTVNAGSDDVTLYYPNGDPLDNVFHVKIDPDPDSAAPIGNPEFAPYGLAVAHDDSLAYIACRNSKDPNGADIFIFDLKRRMTIDTLHLSWTKRSATGHNYRLGLAILLEDDRYLAVTSQDGNSVYLVDLQTGSYDEEVFQYGWTFGVTSTSDEEYLYVTASNGGVAPAAPGWVYELKRNGGSLTKTDSVQAGFLCNGCHVLHGDAQGH